MLVRYHHVLAGLLLGTVLAGCGDDTGPSEEIVVTGTIQNNTETPIPANARLIVVWGVSATSPDYSYVFGEGTLNAADGTFELRLDQPPPSDALNGGALGVGIIIVTTNQSITTGNDVISVPESELIGAAGQFAVIAIAEPDEAVQLRDWADEFGEGYSVGRGVEVQGDFDRFEPVSSSSVVLIIDALENIDFVNWT